MTTLADMLKQRIEGLGYQDIKECARDLEIPYELLRKVIANGHIPKDKTLIYYAEVLGMEASDLISQAYREKVPNDMRHLIAPRGGFAKPSSIAPRQAPVLGRAACGPWLESYASEPDLFEPVEISDPEAFFVIAEGESMIGGNIPPGSYLLVSPKAGVTNGQVVLARRSEEEFTVKTYYRKADGTVILQPLNPAFEPIILDPGEPYSVMRVTEVRIKL